MCSVVHPFLCLGASCSSPFLLLLVETLSAGLLFFLHDLPVVGIAPKVTYLCYELLSRGARSIEGTLGGFFSVTYILHERYRM